MLRLIETLEEKHVTPTREMTQVLVECCRCGAQYKTLEQSFLHHNRRETKRCQFCVKNESRYMTGTAFYETWRQMRRRCYDPKAKGYKHYGGRGIQVCERWQTFQNFYDDMFESYSEGLTIERIDVNGHYSPENCRWATNMEQQANKRNNRVLVYRGEEMHLAELCRRTGVSKMMMQDRLSRGMTPDEAVEHAKASTYGKGRWAQKYGKGRTSLTSPTADRVTGS